MTTIHSRDLVIAGREPYRAGRVSFCTRGILCAGATAVLAALPAGCAWDDDRGATGEAALASTTGGDGQPGDCTEVAGAGICAPTTDREYRHPLRDLQPLPDGSLPFLDAKRSPTGNAYAVGEGARSLVEGRDEALFSGVIEVGVRTMTAAERTEKPSRAGYATPSDKLDPVLRAAMASAGTTEQLPVQIFLERTREGTITQRINRAIAEGAVRTYADREAVRQAELAALAGEIAVATRPLSEHLAVLGAPITYTCEYAPCVTARLTAGQVLALEQRTDIQRMGLLEDSTPDALDGQEKAEVYQTRLFWDEWFQDGGFWYNFDGNNGNTTDIRVAVLDDEGFRDSHVAFKEGTSGSRIHGMWDCRTPPCTSVSGYSGISDHGTAVLGTVLGDYRDGQDPAVVSASSRERRSASGGEAKAYLFWADRSQGDQQAVYDAVVVRSPAPHMLVSSNSVGGGTNCSGEDAKAVGADGVYEAGIAYFKSANQAPSSNPYAGSSTDCKIGPPGEAIGVFTVAGFNDPGAPDWCARKAAPIHPRVFWGGATSGYGEGKYRSIVDITGSYQGSLVPWFSSDTAVGSFSGTSHATPSVASAAVNLIDQMKNYRNTNFIDDPGVLYAWMLNMGDRRNQSGSRMTSRYDHRTGAGNLKMRFVGGPGMDAPWYYYHYELCIDDGEVYTININGGNTLSSDVDSLRATAWWYDRRIESGVAIDDIDLRLVTTGGTVLRSSMDAWDNKERVWYQDVGGKAIQLEVRGYDVTSDVEGCGQNSMRVFVTMMIEDNDRDDGDGPSYDNATCVGVERL